MLLTNIKNSFLYKCCVWLLKFRPYYGSYVDPRNNNILEPGDLKTSVGSAICEFNRIFEIIISKGMEWVSYFWISCSAFEKKGNLRDDPTSKLCNRLFIFPDEFSLAGELWGKFSRRMKV